MEVIINKNSLEEVFANGDIPAYEDATTMDLIRANFGQYGSARDYVRMDVSENLVWKNKFFHPINHGMILAVLFERGVSDGYKVTDIEEILRELRIHPSYAHGNEGVEVLPVYIEGNGSSAFGFIMEAAADTLLNYEIQQGSEYAERVIAVLDDMNNETADGIYDFCGVRTKIIR